MDDLISRQAAIEVCEKYNGQGYIWTCILNDIRKIPSAQPEPHGVCMDCLMKHVCRFKRGLGDYGYCSQWKGAEYG